jgi:hypothetical protein
MDQLIDKSSNTPLTSSVAQLIPELARHLGDLQCPAVLVQAGLDELCKTHCLAVETFAQVVEKAQQMVQASAVNGRITPLKQAALHHLRQAYLYEMLTIVDDTNAEIVTILSRW